MNIKAAALLLVCLTAMTGVHAASKESCQDSVEKYGRKNKLTIDKLAWLDERSNKDRTRIGFDIALSNKTEETRSEDALATRQNNHVKNVVFNSKYIDGQYYCEFKNGKYVKFDVYKATQKYCRSINGIESCETVTKNCKKKNCW